MSNTNQVVYYKLQIPNYILQIQQVKNTFTPNQQEEASVIGEPDLVIAFSYICVLLLVISCVPPTPIANSDYYCNRGFFSLVCRNNLSFTLVRV